jgi:hypothetical protein
MRTLTLDLGALQVETFTTRATPWRAYAAFADTDDADCDTESQPTACETAAADCETGGADCETVYCTEPPVCGELTEEC